MIPVTFQGEDAYLLDDPPDWSSTVDLTAQAPSHREQGLSGRECRRPLSDTLRLSLSYSALIERDALPAFRNALQDLQNKRVLCPLWPKFIPEGTASPNVTASHYALLGDGSAPEIKTHAELPFSRPSYPLMRGVLKDIPDASLLHDELASVDFNFTENSPATASGVATYENTAAIVGSNISPDYPSDIFVAGLGSNIAKVEVVFSQFIRQFPHRLRIVLVSPAGTKVLLMANCGKLDVDVVDIDIFDMTISDSGGLIPEGSDFGAGTYFPTNHGFTGDLGAPAPAHPYTSPLSAFNGQDPNGSWCLFVYSDPPQADGVIMDDGWKLMIATGEGSVYSIVPDAFTPPTGLADGSASVRPLFPFRPNWANRPNEAGAEVNIDRRPVGQGRSTSDSYYAQRSRRAGTQMFTLADDDPWKLLRFFLDQGALQKNFWLPTGIADARLTVDVTSIATTLTVDNPTGIGGNRFLLLDDLATRTPVKVTNPAGPWTLAAAVGQAYGKNSTSLQDMMLARFKREHMTIRFRSPQLAEASLDFQEMPWETGTVSGETFGTTLGTLPLSAMLYEFRQVLPDTTNIWRFTNFERALSNGSVTFTPVNIEHDSIREAATLERQQTNLTCRFFPGNPMAMLIPFQLEWPLEIVISECDVSGTTASNIQALFVGEIESASPDGPFIKAVARSLASIHERRIPRRLIQPSCNSSLFEPAPWCGVDREDWHWIGTVASYNSSTLELALSGVAKSFGVPPIEVIHFFAGGYLEISFVTGKVYRAIADSTAETGGTIVLVLGSPLITAPAAGLAVDFFPGCDGSYATCRDKFGNSARFVGFPWMPVGNPSLVKVSKNVSAGGKK
jgi:hypothetical protein